jgi:tetratricopeptide (TPR) repeat protein
MFKDAFDRLCWILIIVLIISAGFLFYFNSDSDNLKRAAKSSKSLERELAYRARIELITQLYSPVEILSKEGNNQTALLKLDELIRKYPTEGHGHILQGKILYEMGAFTEAVSSYVAGVKLNGDYVDAKSPLSRRTEIERLVSDGMKTVGQKASDSSSNSSQSALRQKLNYLKSRLAGGCE